MADSNDTNDSTCDTTQVNDTSSPSYDTYVDEDVQSFCEDSLNDCLSTDENAGKGSKNYNTNSSSTVLLDNLLDNIENRLSWKNDSVSYSLENRISTLETLKHSISEAKKDLRTIDQREARSINDFKYQLQNMETQISVLDSDVVSKENEYFLSLKKYNQKLEGYDPLLKNIDIMSRNFELQKDDILGEINNKIFAVFGRHVPDFEKGKFHRDGSFGQDWKKMLVGVEAMLNRPGPAGPSAHRYLHKAGVPHEHVGKHDLGIGRGIWGKYDTDRYGRKHSHDHKHHADEHHDESSNDEKLNDSDHKHEHRHHHHSHGYYYPDWGKNRGYRPVRYGNYLYDIDTRRNFINKRTNHFPTGGLSRNFSSKLGKYTYRYPYDRRLRKRLY